MVFISHWKLKIANEIWNVINDIDAEEFRGTWTYVYNLLWNVSKNNMDWWLHRKVE